jgi:hypothetical protein
MNKNHKIIPNGRTVMILRSKYGRFDGMFAKVISSERVFKKVNGTLITCESEIDSIQIKHWMSEDKNSLFVTYPEMKFTNFTEHEHTERSDFAGYSYTLEVETDEPEPFRFQRIMVTDEQIIESK